VGTVTPLAPAGPHAARLKRCLLLGAAAIVLIGGLWLVIQLTSPPPRSGRGSPSLAEIKLTGETRATSLEGLAAQLDTARGENAQLRQDVARLEAQIGKALEGVRSAFERQLASNQNRSEAELARERNRLARELEGLQGAIDGGRTTPPRRAAEPRPGTQDSAGSDWAASPSAAPDAGLASATTGEAPGSSSAPSTPPEQRSETTPPAERRSGAGVVPPLRREGLATPTPRRDGAGYQEAALPGATPPDLPAFPDALLPELPEDALFQERQPPAPATQDPGTASRRGSAAGPVQQAARPVIRILGSDVPDNKPVPPLANQTYRLPATSILTGTLITGLDASTATQSRRDPFPVLLRLQKTAILPNRYQADVRECFVLLAGYGDLSSERAYLRGETVSCVLLDGSVIETRLQGYAAGEDGKAGVRGRLVTKQGQFIARALMIGFIEGVADVLQQGDTVTLGLSQSQNDEGGNPWGSAALRGTGNALDRIAQFYIDQAYNLFPVIEIDAGRQLDIVLTGHLDMPLPNS
jgi:hypothetical protein